MTRLADWGLLGRARARLSHLAQAGSAEAEIPEAPGGPQQVARAREPGRGRDADAPQEIPARGWKDILWRTWKEFTDDQAPLVAAGVTF